jgi:nucleoside-diphosphate-sugar epimerase
LRLGSLSPTRDFNFVSDTVRAFEAVMNSDGAIGQVLNSGSNFEISIGDTVRMIAEVLGQEVEIETDEERLRPEKSEVERLWADNRRLREVTGWAPEFAGLEGLKRGLELTASWFSDSGNLKLYKSDRYNI